MELNIAHIISNDPSNSSFADIVSTPYFRANGWRAALRHARGKKSRSSLSAEELKARGHGREFSASGFEIREALTLVWIIQRIGLLSEEPGRELELRLENHGRSKSVVITSDKLPDLVRSARKWVGRGEEKGVWLVLGSKVAAKNE